MINKILVYFNQLTKAEYDAKIDNNELSSKSIVFVNEPRMIYTHGKEYDGRQLENSDITGDLQGLLDAIERLDGRVSALEGDTLQDINITNLSDGDILIYNDEQGKWVNIPSGNFVTLNTTQENITGEKTFRNNLNADAFVKTEGEWLQTGTEGNDYILLAGGGVILMNSMIDTIVQEILEQIQIPTPVNRTMTISNTNEHVRYYVRDYDASTYENPYAYHTGNKTYTIKDSDNSIRVYVMCDEGYTVTSIGGQPVSNIDGYNVATIPVTDGATITIVSEETATTKSAVNISCGQGGSITAGGTTITSAQPGQVEVNNGSSLILTFTPNSGKVIDTLTVNDIPVTVTGNTYTISNISADTTVVVTWKDQQVTPPTTYTVRYGFAGDSITNIDNIPQNISVTQQSFKTESYTSTATSTEQYWYIAIPTSWTEPTVQYKRGLGPLTIERVNIDNTQYNVYRVTTPHIAGEYTFIIR